MPSQPSEMNEKSCRQPPQAKFAQHILCGEITVHTHRTNGMVKSAGVCIRGDWLFTIISFFCAQTHRIPIQGMFYNWPETNCDFSRCLWRDRQNAFRFCLPFRLAFQISTWHYYTPTRTRRTHHTLTHRLQILNVHKWNLINSFKCNLIAAYSEINHVNGGKSAERYYVLLCN